MHHRHTIGRPARAITVLALTALAVAGCGGGSGDARKLLQETFSAPHRVSSGVLGVELTIDPAGSSTLHGPVTLSFGGPFQSLGPGRLPESDFSFALSGPGYSGSLRILSTGSTGYVTLKGVSYELPQASFSRLETSFAGAATPSGSDAFSRLDSALIEPTAVGQESIGDAETTHIRASVDIPAVLADLSHLLSRASAIGVSGTGGFSAGLSAATQRRIAGEIRNPTFDLWTGVHDRTLRRLQVGATIPVSGQIGQLLGGPRSVDVGLSVQYSDLNEPQTITAPVTTRAFSEFAPRMRAFEQELETGLVKGAPPTGGTTRSSASAASSPMVLRYSKCVQAAGNDVTKMQPCDSLLGGQ